jgi:PAS domain S-box-containing protein
MQFSFLPGWFEVRTFPGHLDGRWHSIVYILKNVTDRKQLEESVQQSEQRFKALVENISEGVELFDVEGRVLYASPVVSRILGIPQGAEIGSLNPMDHLHPEDFEQGFPLFLAMLQSPGKCFTFEMRTQHADGTWIWTEATARNMLNDPGLHAILLKLRAASNWKRRCVKANNASSPWSKIYRREFS